jgi:hypothetical protein
VREWCEAVTSAKGFVASPRCVDAG